MLNPKAVPILRILNFLWQWKLATAATLSFRFFRDIKPHSAYKRLKALEKRGFIQQISDPMGTMFYWVLTKKGYLALKDHLPPLAQDGFKSENLHHDHLLMCFHLGDWLTGTPKGADFFSEQQLRRVEVGEYPDWVPQCRIHRPDGYWRVADKVIGVEVELTCKTEDRYSHVATFYQREKSVDSVFWLVTSEHVAKRIQNYLENARHERIEVHNFVMLPDFEKNGWAAILKFGSEHGKSMKELLGRVEGASWVVPPTELLLDIRKWQTKFVDYKEALKA